MAVDQRGMSPMARQSGLFSWDDAEVNKGGVAWGQLDCFSQGSAWESRALGCSRPGGCGAVVPGPVESSVPACGVSSEVCVETFKACLHQANPVDKVPVPGQCDCYSDIVASGCPAPCAHAIFESFGQVTRRCYGFDAYDGCKYIDSNRLPADRDISAGPEDESEEDFTNRITSEFGLRASGSQRVAALALGVRARAQRRMVPAGNGNARRVRTLLIPAEALSDPDINPELQFRQPAGTYIQQDESGGLIDPWAYNSHAYEPRTDAQRFFGQERDKAEGGAPDGAFGDFGNPGWFDDDDPRE